MNKRIVSKIKYNKINLTNILFFVTVFLIIIQVYFSIDYSTKGIRIKNMEIKLSESEKVILELQSELISTSALSVLEERAQEQGYSRTEKIIYLDKIETFAKLP